ncbi:DNA ligase [Hydrogenovibrio sp. 3SP14C1]|uniref:DNA ligase n=1 Tax=Hydrogenovibrio sp. 3SP14C1 TaxID=3038774 RepID=UPI0024178A0E|nr:DNA ligase [Hydrogenovibrio sp. 3SP14C1]MDG4812231.1 DNA ligase [Hydrogenovibrio sp. 3SP14C1]
MRICHCKRGLCLLFAFIGFNFFSSLAGAGPPKMLLLQTYQENQAVIGWWMSEKLDGVRAKWNGKTLISRGGHEIQAPSWFVEDFPPFELDGELWTKRQDFENVVSIVRQQQPDDRWHAVSYQVFEVPNQAGNLMDRLAVLKDYLVEHSLPHVKIIPQTRIRSEAHLKAEFERLTAMGAEGLVLRAPNRLHETGRSDQALKMKAYEDDECLVVGYKPGKGKITGLVGVLRCDWQGKMRLSIGSGLSLQERKHPPKIGQWITFKYYGLTGSGKPRFPVFMRIRLDQGL